MITELPGYRDQGRPFLAFVYGIAAHDVGVGPEQHLMNGALSKRVGQLLEILPPKQREILLRVVVGLSAEETAEAVESAPGAVRVAQHRALARLRSVFCAEELV